MSNKSKNFRGLGRGLETLLNSNSDLQKVSNVALPSSETRLANDNNSSTLLPIVSLKSGRFQPRQHFNEEALDSLAQSIKSQGLLQPIVVKKIALNQYEIIAGERRWRASQRAGLSEVPVIIRNDINDKESMEIALIENIQREDLNVIEEAEGFKRLIQEFSLTHEEISRIVGRSRAAISNSLRLLDLHAGVQSMVREGKLKMGHVRALLSLDQSQQLNIANKIEKQNLTTRAVETLVQQLTHLDESKGSTNTNFSNNSPIEIQILQDKLSLHCNKLVNIKHKPNGTGDINISYSNIEELKRIIVLLTDITKKTNI